VSLCATGAIAQGTLLFTWQNEPGQEPFNYVASFMVDHSVMDSGWSQQWPASDEAVMAQTVSILDPWGNYFSQQNSHVTAYGQGNWASWEVLFTLDNLTTGLQVHGSYGYGQDGSFRTLIPGVGEISRAFGNWVFDLVPEPSAGSLLLLGGLVWALNSRRAKITNLCGVADRCH
jgi:hypothetical protein